MSFNVTSSSTSVPVIPSSDLLTVGEVKGYSAEKLNEFLKARLKNIDVHINTITETQQVDGDSFLDLTAVNFERWGIPGGPAKKIERLINDIQGETTTNTRLVHVYVDHSNIVIEGKKTVSAFEHIFDKNSKTYYMSHNPVIVGSRPPPNDSGDDNKTHTKEKRVDTEIAVSMVIDTLINIKNPGILILVSGDGDFEPALKLIIEAGELKVGKNKVKFMSLDPEYKLFSFGSGPEPTNRKKSLDIFHNNNQIWENKDLIDCYIGLQSSFCWWHRTDTDLKLATRWLENNFKDIQMRSEIARMTYTIQTAHTAFPEDSERFYRSLKRAGTSIDDIPQFTPKTYPIDENDEDLKECVKLIKSKLSVLKSLLPTDAERERCEYVECFLDIAIIIARKNKRSADVAFKEDYIYGIVTTAELWYFLKYNSEGIFYTGKNPLRVEFNESALEDSNEELNLRNNVRKVLEVIVGLLIDKVGTIEPSVKKAK
ncbi:4073_t:CDS:10 [Funneliformis mosseae]|uniref:4073_t:CDS:1 n=1 Tax=Funneliformis mosseae TaxID=27381 RepID=A0A9N9EHX7_FUNMO|nr:4073_t:CDS:10 [Funneliformis mosseae]